MSSILCGPLLRYVDRRYAVIWLELDRDMEIEVALAPLRHGMPLAEITARGWPVEVGDTWYAWIRCGPLLPDTWYEYRVTARADGGDFGGCRRAKGRLQTPSCRRAGAPRRCGGIG